MDYRSTADSFSILAITDSKELIQEEIKIAIRNRNADRLETVQLLWSVIKNKESEKKAILTEHEITSIIKDMIEERRKLITSYEKAKRQDLSKKTEEQLIIIQEFLPKILSDEEVNRVAKMGINTIGRDVDKIMMYLEPRIKGRVDTEILEAKVESLLSTSDSTSD